ncbi:MAG: response regulator [Candidatus Omnitrophica bacterium]|nr:response regulator [Candidatus Omnitrophota bacterium]
MVSVLLIDDERGICECFADILAQAMPGFEFRFSSALSASQGFDLFLQNRPHIVFVDLELGTEEKGTDFIRRIRSMDPAVKTVLLSGFLEDHLKQSPPWGTDALLEKPVSSGQLARLVRELLKVSEGGDRHAAKNSTRH